MEFTHVLYSTTHQSLYKSFPIPQAWPQNLGTAVVAQGQKTTLGHAACSDKDSCTDQR